MLIKHLLKTLIMLLKVFRVFWAWENRRTSRQCRKSSNTQGSRWSCSTSRGVIWGNLTFRGLVSFSRPKSCEYVQMFRNFCYVEWINLKKDICTSCCFQSCQMTMFHYLTGKRSEVLFPYGKLLLSWVGGMPSNSESYDVFDTLCHQVSVVGN